LGRGVGGRSNFSERKIGIRIFGSMFVERVKGFVA
jgi:hypothetical protein